MFKGFKEMVKETSAASTMRWVLIFVTIFTTLVFWGTWLFISILNNTVSDVPTGTATAYGASNAAAIFGKVMQKIFGEKNIEVKDE